MIGNLINSVEVALAWIAIPTQYNVFFWFLSRDSVVEKTVP